LSKDHQTEVKVDLPISVGVSGLISNIENGCNFNNSPKENNIKIFLPDEKELSELKSITNFSGLPLNFKVFSANIQNAVATIINDERYILYDPKLLDFANNQTESFWSSISILAHEIGHHLSGHTLNQLVDGHKAELEADKFSGFILYKMGASIEQAISAISTIGSEMDSDTHPSKIKRIKAIEEGWNEAYKLDYRSALPPPLKDDPNTFYEYTLEMLNNEKNSEILKNRTDSYDFMYGVITDSELIEGQVDNFVVEVIKTGKWWENNVGSLDEKRITINFDKGFGVMCNRCYRQLKELVKAGRRIKFAFEEGRPDGGTSLNGVFFGSYIKAIDETDIDFYLRNSNTVGRKKLISDFLVSEENRNIEDILSFYSENTKRYWNVDKPSKMEISEQYTKVWENSSNSQNIVKDIVKLSSDVYILTTNFKFYDKKDKEFKSLNTNVKFVFDSNDKIIETYGTN